MQHFQALKKHNIECPDLFTHITWERKPGAKKNGRNKNGNRNGSRNSFSVEMQSKSFRFSSRLKLDELWSPFECFGCCDDQISVCVYEREGVCVSVWCFVLSVCGVWCVSVWCFVLSVCGVSSEDEVRFE